MLERAIRDPSGGVNQTGLRDHNERLVMSLIQRHGQMPGADIARRTGLSPQTVSVILRSLETEGYLLRGDPMRGRVGKPSIPMGLNPDGAFSVGLKIGRRSADLVLTDIMGQLRAQENITYKFPTPTVIFEFLSHGLDALALGLTPEQATRIAGIGIAAPFELWNWHDVIGAPEARMAAWRDLSFADEIARFSSLPVLVENDATAACRAEQVFGRGRELTDYAYFFIGSFIGGGVVLNHSVYTGQTGNAGAFGSLPVVHGGKTRQLLDAASLFLLETRLERDGLDAGRLWAKPQDWSGIETAVEDWIEETARAMAFAVVSVSAVIDFEAILIDGGFPPDVRLRLVQAVRSELGNMDARGIRLPMVEPGTIGGNARAIGASCAPIFDRFLLNSNVLRG